LNPKTKNNGSGLLLALMLSPAALAQPTVPLSEAVEAAWRRSAQSAEAAGNVRRAQAERISASALWAAPPAIEIGVIRDRRRATGSARETEVGIAVPLWLPGQRAARVQQADAESSAATASVAAARLRVAGTVRELAAEAALLRAEVAAAEAQDRELDVLAKDVERRVAAGEMARADALAANAERLEAATSLAQARQRLRATELQWKALTGLTALPALSSAPGGGAAIVHPALHAAALNVETARKRVDAVRASRRDAPELLLRARQEVATGEPNANGIGVALRIPFGTASRNEPLLAAALSELEVAEATERELRQQLEAETAAARSADESARQQLAHEAARAKLLRERAALIEKSFKAGETALPDMLRALTAAAQAEASLARQQALLSQATLRLHQALGVMP
jgi:cobalt-zinc-cadmium efflux system outer membrane protein